MSNKRGLPSIDTNLEAATTSGIAARVKAVVENHPSRYVNLNTVEFKSDYDPIMNKIVN